MARETAAERKAREAADEVGAPMPAEPMDRVDTATADAPEGLQYGEPRLADRDGEARPYADALTQEHAEVLREAGQHPDQQ